MIDKKYELWGDAVAHGDEEVFRIKALRDFNDVKKGDLGGYVASEANLVNDPEDRSWVYDDSVVKGEGRVEKDSFIDGQSVVKDSRITNGSSISHASKVEHSRIDGSNVQNSRSFYANVVDSDISHECVVRNSRIENSDLGNGVKVLHSTAIDSSLVNDASISKGAHITNVQLDGESVEYQKFSDYSTIPVLNFEDIVDLEDFDKGKGLPF